MKLLIFITLVVSSSCRNPITIKSPKIIGGEVITYDKAPYQIALLESDRQICGGSALSQRFVLTAAHCTHKTKVKVLSVLIGTDTLAEGGTTIKVLKYTNHPKYDPQTIDYDYSVLRLAKVKNFPTNVVFVKLPNEGEEIEGGVDLFVSGWGDTKVDGDDKNLLRGLTLPSVDVETCKKNHGADAITDRMICAGDAEGKTSSCQGDSGGPVVRSADKVQVGIVSWGPEGCAILDKPSVFAKVSYVRKWIKKIAKV